MQTWDYEIRFSKSVELFEDLVKIATRNDQTYGYLRLCGFLVKTENGITRRKEITSVPFEFKMESIKDIRTLEKDFNPLLPEKWIATHFMRQYNEFSTFANIMRKEMLQENAEILKKEIDMLVAADWSGELEDQLKNNIAEFLGWE